MLILDPFGKTIGGLIAQRTLATIFDAGSEVPVRPTECIVESRS